MKPTPLLLGSAALLVPGGASAQDCKLCVDDRPEFAQVMGEWFAEIYAVTDKGEVTAVASLSIDRQNKGRFEGEICVGLDAPTHCESISGTVSRSGEVIIVGTGEVGLNAHFDLDEADEAMSGKLSFRAPAEWFAEAYSEKEWFAEAYAY